MLISYTTMVLGVKYHKVGAARNHGDGTPPSFFKLKTSKTY